MIYSRRLACPVFFEYGVVACGRSIDGGKGSRGIGLRASVLLVLGAFRSAFLAVSSVDATAASQGTLSLRRRFGRGDFIPLVNVEGASTRLFWSCFGGGNAPSHGRHQMGVNSGVQWDNGHLSLSQRIISAQPAGRRSPHTEASR